MTVDIRLLRWPERDQRDFDDLADRLNAIRQLTRMSRSPATPATFSVHVPAGPEAPTYRDKAQALYAHRRERAKLFGPISHMFQEAAWDIMLDLFIAHEDGRPISITSACIAACVPPTTALRWIKVMEREGIVRCWPAEHDKRSRYVALTDTTLEMMLRYLDTI